MTDELSLTDRDSEAVILDCPLTHIGHEKPHAIYPILEMTKSISRSSAGFFALLIFIAFAPALVANSTNFFGTMAATFAIIFLIALAVLWRAALNATKLKITGDGIKFPNILAINHSRIFRTWEEIEFLDVHRKKNRDGRIGATVFEIGLRNGKSVEYVASRLSAPDLASLSQALCKFAPERIDTTLIKELPGRAWMERETSPDFVYLQGHRQILPKNFGLTNSEIYRVGEQVFNGSLCVEKVVAADGFRSIYHVSTMSGDRYALHEFNLILLSEHRQECNQSLGELSEAYAQLDVPGLARIKGHYHQDDRFALSTELVIGRTMRELHSFENPMPEQKALNTVLQLAESIDVVHRASTSYYLGSIRPDCLYKQSDGSFVISEYGFASETISRYSNLLLLDCAYAAPEQLRGQGSAASDVYALGAILYFLLTGADPQPASQSHAKAVKGAVSQSTDRLIARMTGEQDSRPPLSTVIYELGGLSRLEKVSHG